MSELTRHAVKSIEQAKSLAVELAGQNILL